MLLIYGLPFTSSCLRQGLLGFFLTMVVVVVVKTTHPLTTPGSPHRQLCCDIANHCSRQLFVSMRDRDLPRELLDVLIEVGTVLDRGVQEVPFAKLMEGKTGCEYHEQTRSSTPCYKTKFGD
jgi:hypothetical protein